MVEKSSGSDHMTCDCGAELCYLCGVEYVGGMPCNCTGQRNWVEDEPEVNDPVIQQQLMDEAAGHIGGGGGHDEGNAVQWNLDQAVPLEW